MNTKSLSTCCIPVPAETKRKKVGVKIPIIHSLTFQKLPKLKLTFNADDVVPYLLSYETIRYKLNQIVNSVNARMYTFESLNFLSYCEGVIQKGLQTGIHVFTYPNEHRHKFINITQKQHKTDCL